MKIVFMGTPEFAIPSLKILLQSKHKIAAVVSAPDKERGRGKQISSTSVKIFSSENNLEVLTPISLKDEKFIQRLKELEPDLIIVVAFKILPKEVYSIPKEGSFNLHGSLLPKYRGAAPIQWAIINGETETGVTTFSLADKVDTGNVIIQEKIKIDDDDDFGTLHDKMMIIGANVVSKTVELIENGKVVSSKQNDSIASPAPKITKEICKIDWARRDIEIHNLVRGLSPHPGAYFERNGKSYKVFKTKIIGDSFEAIRDQFKQKLSIDDSQSQNTIKILESKKEIFVKTNNSYLQILELQPEGRKRMTAEEFLRGYSLTD
ncbi:MAG: methionyl-tRNA formyltransferase [Ignavibacteriales bacterium]|nr:methionyl-tRNA formyltransferase [Ignavibacteriales bacterium]